MYIGSNMGVFVADYLADKISTAADLLNYKEGYVVMMADFHHKGGEACFGQMASEIEFCGEVMFPNLTVESDAGW
jgi:hypothetical protein